MIAQCQNKVVTGGARWWKNKAFKSSTGRWNNSSSEGTMTQTARLLVHKMENLPRRVQAANVFTVAWSQSLNDPKDKHHWTGPAPRWKEFMPRTHDLVSIRKRAGKGPFQRLCWSLFPSFHFPYLYRIHNTVYPHFSEDTYNANVMRNNLFTDCVETRGRKSSWKSH